MAQQVHYPEADVNELLFSLGNLTAVAGWVLLIFVPRWRGLAQAMATVAVPAILSVAYTALIWGWWSRRAGGFGTLAEVHGLLQTPELLLAGWFHYLAFDLFVGGWVARESRREGVPHLVVVPILLLTFLFGPIGYLTSLVVRGVWRVGRTRREEDAIGKGSAPAGPVARSFDDFVRREPKLAAAALACFAAAVPTAVAWALDGRTFGGVDVWIKPFKFEVSTGIYLATLAFFFPLAGDAFRRSAAGRFVVWGSIITTGFELFYITWRASRGEASHFNTATPIAAALYALMGIGALTLAAAGPVLAWGVAMGGATPVAPAYRLAVVIGLLLTFGLGVMGGVYMAPGPSHSVGTHRPGDPIIPLVGWSRTVGDLRVAHFMGLHAQQAIAVAGALAAAWLGSRARTAVIAFAALYTLATFALFVQALAGRPFLPS
jgi:Domain of unknown function (DUF4281)